MFTDVSQASAALCLMLLSSSFRFLRGDTVTFRREVSCGLVDRVAAGCAQLKGSGFRSVLECTSQCSGDAKCVGVSLTTDHFCYYHLHCQQIFRCGQGDTLFAYSKMNVSSLENSYQSIDTDGNGHFGSTESSMTHGNNVGRSYTDTSTSINTDETGTQTSTSEHEADSTSADIKALSVNLETMISTPGAATTPANKQPFPASTQTVTSARRVATTPQTSSVSTPATISAPGAATQPATIRSASAGSIQTTVSKPGAVTTPANTKSASASSIQTTVTTPGAVTTPANTRFASTSTGTEFASKAASAKTRASPPTTIAGVICENFGVYDKDLQACICQGGWVGEFCEDIPTSCQDLVDAPGYSNGDYMTDIKPMTWMSPLKVMCRVTGSSALTLIMSNTGHYDNAKSWDEYRNGFYHDDCNFWVGLNVVQQLNLLGYNALSLASSFDFLGTTNVFKYTYRVFTVNALGGYAFGFITAEGPHRVSGNHSTAGFVDCLSSLKTFVRFSTWDNDQDTNAFENCAEEAGVGWWFPISCSTPCNPIGRNYQTLPGPQSVKHMDMFGLDFADSVSYTNIQSYMYLE